jgi:hypothetical protein
MSFLTKDILDAYRENSENKWYLEKYFSDNNHLGFYPANAKNSVDTEWNQTDSHIATIDEHNTYKINHLGLRGEIDENATAIASGCSITFGIGVPELGRWTNILGKKLNKNITNLGNPGGSVESICTNIIQYCRNNKMPKEIFCLFPDFFRSMVVADHEFYKSSKIVRDDPNKRQLHLTFCNPVTLLYEDSLFMEVKDKTNIEDSVSPHQLILDAVNFIYILESFCLTNNIKLYWSTWDIHTDLVMTELIKIKNFKLKNFTSIFQTQKNLPIGSFVSNNCNSDHESEFKDDACWFRGSDYSIINYKKVTDYAHPGIHVQQHFADLFYNLYQKDSFHL